MKKLFLLLLLSISFCAVKAQPYFANNTQCDLEVSVFCYPMPGCTPPSACTPVTTVTAGNLTFDLSTLTNCCGVGNPYGYMVRFPAGGPCQGLTLYMCDGGTSCGTCYQSSAFIPFLCNACFSGFTFPVRLVWVGNTLTFQ